MTPHLASWTWSVFRLPPGEKPDSYTDAFTESLVKLADEHHDVVAITAAMPELDGAAAIP